MPPSDEPIECGETPNEDWLSLEQDHGAGVYPFRGITLVRGRGAKVWDDTGRTYIDCVGGIGSAILGHGHPAIAEAIYQQAGRMSSCPGSFTNDTRARALQRLSSLTSFQRFFLCNSGTEANEGAMKIARLATGRTRIVAAKRGFHGRTFGALTATWDPKYRMPFAPLIPEVEHVTFNDISGLQNAVTNSTAAVLLEPIQGEGGIHPATDEYLHTARRVCDQNGAILIFDEVQTGFGRTGRLFGHHHYSVDGEPIRPDIMTLAKGIASGFPMGAIALGERIEKLPPGSHGSTFGGNPLACASCLATLSVLEEENLVARAEELGERAQDFLQSRLASCRMVREIRGRGLMIGIELRQRVAPLIRALAGKGVLALQAGSTVLRLLPPLVIEDSQWETVLNLVAEAIESLETQPSLESGAS